MKVTRGTTRNKVKAATATLNHTPTQLAARELTPLAAELRTLIGQQNALAELYAKLRSARNTRDETSSLLGAVRCVGKFSDQREHEEDRALKAAVERELRLTREAQAANTTSTRASFDSDLDLPIEGSRGDH